MWQTRNMLKLVSDIKLHELAVMTVIYYFEIKVNQIWFKMGGVRLRTVENFKYLETTVSNDRNINNKTNHKV